MSIPTASQTVGPFFGIGLTHLCGDAVMAPSPRDAVVAILGRVLDGAGSPVSDVAIEIWQASVDGEYDMAGARGFGRLYPNESGKFAFTTVRPGSVGGQAPHLVVSLFMRGLLKPLVTRLYFPGEPENDTDPVLALVPAARRATLIAREDAEGLRWDVVLQGDDETVFFEW